MSKLNIESLFGDKYPHASFHDSTINKIGIDLVTREVKLSCVIDVGNPEDKDSASEQSHGVLTLTGLLYIAVEPPCSDYRYEEDGLDISYDGPVEDTTFKSPIPNLPEPMPDKAFTHCFYISNWNSFMFIAAMGAKFEWGIGNI
jgi:hypothetical protein